MAIKIKESDIKKTILDYLDKIPRSLVCEIQLSGRPIKKPGVGTIMIPFNGKYYRKGMSDIMFYWKGSVFAFEVKTVSEWKWWYKNRSKYILKPPEMIKNKKHKHFVEQWEYIQRIKNAGGYGGFVCTLEQVQEILNCRLRENNLK